MVTSRYDREADVLCIRFAEGAVDASEEVRPGLLLDLDGEGRLLAIEVMSASKQLPPSALTTLPLR